MKTLPSLRNLSYLVALDDHGHFGHAAAAADASQSTFSAGIRELEQQLGVPLAERDRRKVLMTPLGRQLAARARRLLADAGALVEMAQAASKPMSGGIALGSIPTIGPFLLPGLLPELRKRYPGLAITLREDKTEALLAQLANGSLDLLLIALPYETPGCDTLVLFDDAYVFACDRSSPFANARAMLSKDIAGQPLMLLEPGHCLHSHALPVLRTASKSPQTTFSATSLQTLVAMVSVGMGTTLLPQLAVDGGLLRGSKVITKPLGYRAGVRSIALCWRRNSGRASEFRELGDAIRSWAASAGISGPAQRRHQRVGAGPPER